jgi:CubicO group peptidase (beta-lactamase class C family)
MTPQARIDAALAPYARSGAPGLAVAVVHGGKVAYRRAIGLANLAHGIAIGADTAFRIGSVSKHFAVAVALMLAREGRLDIEAPVRKYLSEAPAYEPMPTVRQLMNNTAGVPDFLELLIASGAGVQRPVTWEQSRDLVLRQPSLNCVPGTEFIYSAGGFLLLCMIVERLAGAPMEAILAERLFAPLGLERTALVRNDRPVVANMASPYIESVPGVFVRGGWGLEANCEGALVSTLDDMAVWAAELVRPRLLGADIVAAMTEPLIYANGRRGTYGLGLYARREGRRRVFGHGGRMPGFRAELRCFQDDDLALVLLTNLHGIDPYALGRVLGAAWFGDPAPKSDSGDSLPPAGRYRAPDTGDVLELRHEGKRPILAASSGPLPLATAEDGWWEPVSAISDLRLRATNDGLAAEYCGRPARYLPLAAPDAVAPAEFVGHYRSETLGSTYCVRAEAGGRLAVRIQGELGYYDTILDPLSRDLFRAAPADPRAAWNQPLLRFLRGTGGAVGALLYSTDRTRALRFVKVSS